MPGIKASTIIFAAFAAGTPNGPAAGPERKLTIPSLNTVASSAYALGVTINPEMIAAPANRMLRILA